MINEQMLQGNWNQIKGSIKEHWGTLTNDDLRAFSGNVDQLVGVIQRKTGETREAVRTFLEELTADGSTTVAKAAEAAREYANRAAETIQDTYEDVADRVRSGYSDAEAMVRNRPAESVAVAFGAGLVTGLVVGLVLRAR
ncbi:MAG: DUF883 family protein [Planctomycetia bacterium]|nr:DUF883 family protein [Planctomycetia bacterium]